ncbi:hypothetical protein Pmani_025090 [Petrolisthes manimaculis]|uniref:UDP-D-xylose:beta-D-glucoside alpha-1,3-D-xylosyltransferase n=1 Tax=Petrolisthes manimaculis TaxID=1843537 RepID=A0AAE1P692_9EUCA|nr:hypothetical protein Pmani_025090 [Petrolisthes manimaculis]
MVSLFLYVFQRHHHPVLTVDPSHIGAVPLVVGSPSLTAPLVMVVCAGANNTINDYVLLYNANDTSEDLQFAEKVQGIWTRQAEQIYTLFTTLLYFTKSAVWRIIVVTDSKATFQKVLDISSHVSMHRLQLEHSPLWLPENQPQLSQQQWRPCVWAKLFLAESLPNEDAVVYVDTDVVFLGPGEDLWWLLKSLGPQQALALAPEPQYQRDQPSRPFAGRVGLNTGMMALNLTRLRQLDGGGLGSAVLRAGMMTPSPRHDQDALNHYLSLNPHLLLEVSSRWNFLPSSCFREAPECTDCISAGITLLHGADMSFFRVIDRKVLRSGYLQATYQTLTSLRLGQDPRLVLVRLQRHLAQADFWAHIYPCSNNTGLTYALTLALADAAMAISLHLPSIRV